jgi:polysaccharide pyruvyl transferase WcaK-like protein
MKIAISGNVYMLPDIMEVQEELEAEGHKAIPAFEFLDQLDEQDEGRKQKNRVSFFEKLKKSDALLVLNKSLKDGRENYISGSSFLEMGFAHALGKKIFLLQGIPEVSYKDEILAMHPIVLNGNLNKIS